MTFILLSNHDLFSKKLKMHISDQAAFDNLLH